MKRADAAARAIADSMIYLFAASVNLVLWLVVGTTTSLGLALVFYGIAAAEAALDYRRYRRNRKEQ